MAVNIPVKTKYDGKGFDQAQRDASRLRKLQERHNRAVISETKQQIAGQRRLASLSKKLEKDLAAEQAKRTQQMKVGVGIALAATAAITAAGKAAVDAAHTQAAAEAQLEARLQSTRGAAGLTANELKKMASELQNVTNIGDEATIAAQAMLLSFTNIHKETFPRATKATLDMAVAINNGATPSAEQLKNTSIQLGKALNDPVKGITALQRVGVAFTDAQKEQIETMVKHGRVAEAQALILAELEKEFGGSAEAARQADGGFIAVSNSFGDMTEQVGFLILEMNQAIGVTDALANAFSRGADTINQARVAFGGGSIDDQIKATEQAIAELEAMKERVNASPLGFGIAAIEEGIEEQKSKLAELQSAVRETVPPIRELADAEEDEADASALAAENQKKYQQRLKETAEAARAARQAQMDAVGSLLDIEEKATEDIDATWDEYFESEQQAFNDHTERMQEIGKRGNAELAAIDRQLQKDLAKNERDLRRELEKSKEQEKLTIRRMEEDFAKEQDHKDKRRRVDALADQRLFDFEMQQLAAEGQGNAIREALDRRKIEEEIARDKAATEAQIEDEKHQVAVDRVREDAQIRRDEMKADAAIRAADLEQQAAEETEIRRQQLTEELEAERQNYSERMAELRKHRDEKLEEIEASKNESIEQLGEEAAGMKELSQKELSELVGIFAKYGADAGNAFADGLAKGLERASEIRAMVGGQKTAGDVFADIQGGTRPQELTQQELAATGPQLGFQHGGSLVVGGGVRMATVGGDGARDVGGGDDTLVSFRARRGERVTVTPGNAGRGSGAGGGASVINFIANIEIQGMTQADKRQVEDMWKANTQRFVDEVLVPWAS